MLFWFFIVFGGHSAGANQHSAEWLSLLHLDSPSSESHVKEPEFFASHCLKDCPSSEWSLFRTHLKDFPTSESFCDFPARAKWVAREEALSLNLDHCPNYQTYSKIVDPSRVSLVFSSFALHSPASIFGHVMLRFDGNTSDKLSLIGSGVNFAAATAPGASFFYLLKGLFGGLKSHFSLMPYYQKVREYNGFESRDLIELELDLPREAKERLKDHIYELGNLEYQYGFFHRNCASELVWALNAASPELELTKGLRWEAIPTVVFYKVLEKPGLVKRISIRASQRRKFKTLFNRLSKEKQKGLLARIQRLEKELKEDSPYTVAGDVQVLDAEIDYLEMSHQTALASGDKRVTQAFVNRLSERSAFDVKREDASVEQVESLPIPHPARRIELWFSPQSTRAGLGYRFALHDALDPIKGLPAFGELEVLHGRISYGFSKRDILLEFLDILHFHNFSPIEPWDRPYSFQFRTGLRTKRYEGIPSLGYTNQLTLGMSLGNESVVLNGGFRGQFSILPFRSSAPVLELESGPRMMVLARNDRMAGMLESFFIWRPWFERSLGVDLSGEFRYHITNKMSIAIRSRWGEEPFEVMASIFIFHS